MVCILAVCVVLSLKNATQPFVVHGDALVLIERLDDEFTKILQNTDAHSTDYVHKLVHHGVCVHGVYMYACVCVCVHVCTCVCVCMCGCSCVWMFIWYVVHVCRCASV